MYLRGESRSGAHGKKCVTVDVGAAKCTLRSMRCADRAAFASESIQKSKIANPDLLVLCMRKTSYDATIVGAGPMG